MGPLGQSAETPKEKAENVRDKTPTLEQAQPKHDHGEQKPRPPPRGTERKLPPHEADLKRVPPTPAPPEVSADKTTQEPRPLPRAVEEMPARPAPFAPPPQQLFAPLEVARGPRERVEPGRERVLARQAPVPRVRAQDPLVQLPDEVPPVLLP